MSKVFTIAEGLENMGAIRTGGQGSVYKGRRIGEIITAIKLLPTPIFSQTEEDKHYLDFTNEVKKLQRVNESPNPNIVKILSYGVSETGCFPYIEMEYIDGPDLGELLKPPHQPVFTIKEIIKVADHLSHALAHCHNLDVKHGDIKSNNVKYNQHTGNYVLLDFGLAILSDEERRTSMRRAGAIEFMAPEQNEGKMFFETDVYSFGIILFELLAGKVPFPLDGNSETARNKVMVAHMETTPPDALSLRAASLPVEWSDEQKAMEMQVPEWLLSLIYKCLEKKPDDRFVNGIELNDYISHHRIYTAEVAGLVKNEDHKWQTVVSQKDEELEELKAIIARQEKELEALRQNVPVTTAGLSAYDSRRQRKVS
ncbi:MAG: serine/threonine protein kinase, partial [Chitinophagaceae bacterium]